jgi:hypothetical protein
MRVALRARLFLRLYHACFPLLDWVKQVCNNARKEHWSWRASQAEYARNLELATTSVGASQGQPTLRVPSRPTLIGGKPTR